VGRHHTATGMYTYAASGVVVMVEYDGGARHRTDLSRERVEAVLRRVSACDVGVTAIELATTWTDRAFLAATYRKDRVILAGDAAHVHAPLGGQGLNLGLGDALNLGSKLAATICGDAPAGLLDSYERERRPVAEQVLDWSRAQVALMRPDQGSAALRAIFRDLIDTRDGATYMAGRVWGAAPCHDVGAAHTLSRRSAPTSRLQNAG
jgi:2-polyprenyl-6-methoxyphenol hydroxylase-like FAD-dependent oxidoreductase